MERISKTQKKKEALSLQDLGGQLVHLSADQVQQIHLPMNIANAVNLAKTLKKHGARLRQMQYIGTLMRKYDPAPIQEALHNIERGIPIKAAELKKVEKWRDELIAGNDPLREKLLQKYPHADRKHLTSLIQNAQNARQDNNPSPASSRALFRYLNMIQSESVNTA